MVALNPAASSGGGSGSGYSRKIRSGAILEPIGSAAVGNTTYVSPTMMGMMFEQSVAAKLKSIRAWCSTVGGNAKVAVWALDPTTLLPTGNPVATSASLATPGGAAEMSFPISGGSLYDGSVGADLPAGAYCAFLVRDTTATVFSVIANSGPTANGTILGAKTTGLVGSTAPGVNILYQLAAYANAFPDFTGVGEVGSGVGGPTAGAGSTPALAIYPSGVHGSPYLKREYN